MNWKYFFNPFLKFSERYLLLIGILSVIAGSFIGMICSVTFDGVFSTHPSVRTFAESLKENVINVSVVFILLLILGKIINMKTRLIDILAISMIYRIPLYLSAFFVKLPVLDRVIEKIEVHKDHLTNLEFDPLELVLILGISSVLMIFLAYAVILLVNGFRTATNLKKWPYYIAFVIVLLAAEIISQTLITNF